MEKVLLLVDTNGGMCNMADKKLRRGKNGQTIKEEEVLSKGGIWI